MTKTISIHPQTKRLTSLKVWADALRSGDYAQTAGRLEKLVRDGGGYCCLGVKSKLDGVRKDRRVGYGSPPHWMAIDHQLHDASLTMPNGDEVTCGVLARLNDNRLLTFAEIADVIDPPTPTTTEAEG